jgi:dipeptidyl aminopeptidase/acylaminoacyl peptidase
MHNSASNTPFGSWPSPLSAQQLTTLSLRLAEPRLENGDLYWLETRPQQKGRNALVRMSAQGQIADILPEDCNLRTRANEYGGAPWTIHQGIVYAVLDHDQRVYRFANEQLTALTTEGPYRYADFSVDEARKRLICIREDYQPEEPRCEIIAIALDGSGECQVLVTGDDFYSNPRLSPDGNYLSWLSWNHPDMPWDATTCQLAMLDDQGRPLAAETIAGGAGESVFQPQWSPDGDLFFVSDRTGWWNLYRYRQGQTEALCPMAAEFATPQWVYGMSTYGFLNAQELVCSYTKDGLWFLARLSLADGQLTELKSQLNDISAIVASDNTAAFIGASATDAPALFMLNAETGQPQQCYPVSAEKNLANSYISQAESISFPTTGGTTAHAFYYPPCNPDVALADNALPPLLVMCHGGPTGTTSAAFNPKIQYWTTRGFAVVDVNYRGSTGYGRPYRDALKQQWGIADVEDVVNAAEYLVKQQKADPEKIAIRGSSAGGYTVLAALTFTHYFKAGASLYGIGNLETLTTDTHKFESRYLDSLVGDWPAQQLRYRERSPLFHTEKLQCPVIFLQGLQDKVVPPDQAEQMLAAMAQHKIPRAYVTFTDEGHGFRQSDNIVRAMETEWYFYGKVFGFPLPDDIHTATIEDLTEVTP